jgi:hypothetical protein
MADDGRPNEHEEEREFLEGLKARSGRDLAAWMAAIAAQDFHDKNAIIDWLRTQGFPFARASWLERIHRNGGKPIHAGAPPAAPAEGGRSVAAPLQPALRPAVEPEPVPAKPQPTKPQQAKPKPAKPPAARSEGKPAPMVEPASDGAALEKLVAMAKGYQPLYRFLEAQIRQAIPGVVVAPRGSYISFGAPRELAAVTLHPTEIRLGLGLGDAPFDARVQKAKLRGPGATITHMVVLTDARQVNEELLALVKAANDRVNGGV